MDSAKILLQHAFDIVVELGADFNQDSRLFLQHPQREQRIFLLTLRMSDQSMLDLHQVPFLIGVTARLRP